MGRFLKKKTIKLYQDNLGDLIKDLGREVIVYVGSGVPSANWDPVLNEPIDPNEEITYDDTTYKITAIVKWMSPAEEYQFLPGGRISPADLSIRARLDEVLMSGSSVNNDTIFHHARKILVDGQEVKVMGKPVKKGLRDLFVVDVFARRVEDGDG